MTMTMLTQTFLTDSGPGRYGWTCLTHQAAEGHAPDQAAAEASLKQHLALCHTRGETPAWAWQQIELGRSGGGLAWRLRCAVCRRLRNQKLYPRDGQLVCGRCASAA